jgi:hypothetical protein
MESNKSKLYQKARDNKNTERPFINNKLIKANTVTNIGIKLIQNEKENIEVSKKNSSNLILPKINNSHNRINNINEGTKESYPLHNIERSKPSNKLSNKITLHKAPKIKLKSRQRKEYMNDNILKVIQVYLDLKSIGKMMLTCKKFYKTINENDHLWFFFYAKRFSTKKTKYEENKGKWKLTLLNSLSSIYKNNYNSLKTKFTTKFSKNSFANKKDVYFLSNQLYANLKCSYTLSIDGILYPVKYVFTNKILSHINFFTNFDQEFIDLIKVKKIVLYVTEKNLGLLNIKLLEYDMKKKKFENLEQLGISLKICKIYSDKETILSTFDKNLIFFFNISLPICKICECLFDFMRGIHGKNLDYFDDVDSKFGLLDYTLLINLKSWNNIFFTININTLDFKDGFEDDFYYYENTSQSNLF